MKWYEKLWYYWVFTIGILGLISLGMLWIVLPIAAYACFTTNSYTCCFIFTSLTIAQFIAIYQIKD